MIGPKHQNTYHSHAAEGTVNFLNDNDILCGRGSGPNDHIGNKAFRNLVSTRRKEYLETTTRSQKARIAREIISVVKSFSPPGRFLEKVTDTSWDVVSEGKALEKVKQALRQMRHRRSIDATVARTIRADFIKSMRRNSAPPIYGRAYDQSFMQNTDFLENVHSSSVHMQHMGNLNDLDEVLSNPASNFVSNSQAGDLQTRTNNSFSSSHLTRDIPYMGNPLQYENAPISAKYCMNQPRSLDKDEKRALQYPFHSRMSHSDFEPEPIHIKSNGDIVFQKSLKASEKKLDQNALFPQSPVIVNSNSDVSSSVSIYSVTSIESELDPQPLSIDLESDPLDDEASAEEYLNVVLALDDLQSAFPHIA